MKNNDSNNKITILHLVRNEEEDITLDEGHYLKELVKSMDTKSNFTNGQLIKWKAGLKNTHFPNYGEPAIVREVFKKPIYDTFDKGSSTPYFREPLSMIIGVIAPDGDFLEFHVDKRRFEPY